MPTKNFLTDKFTVIIPTFTNTQGLLAVLRDIEKFYENASVILVNNDRKTPLEEKIKVQSYRLNISILNNRKNYGFARAANDGARRAEELTSPEYLIFLNDDLSFVKRWIEDCIAEIKRNRWFASVPLLINNKGVAENYGYKVLPFGKIQLLTNPKQENADGYTGAAIVFVKKDFFNLQGFDPIYFAYLEDVDLFLRARKMGMEFGLVQKVRVFHEGQKTSSQFKVKKAYLDFKNWNILIAKNWGLKKIVFNLPQILLERLRNLWGIVKAFQRIQRSD